MVNYSDLVHRVNLGVAQSPVGWYFKLEGSGHVGFSSLSLSLLMTPGKSPNNRVIAL